MKKFPKTWIITAVIFGFATSAYAGGPGDNRQSQSQSQSQTQQEIYNDETGNQSRSDVQVTKTYQVTTTTHSIETVNSAELSRKQRRQLARKIRKGQINLAIQRPVTKTSTQTYSEDEYQNQYGNEQPNQNQNQQQQQYQNQSRSRYSSSDRYRSRGSFQSYDMKGIIAQRTYINALGRESVFDNQEEPSIEKPKTQAPDSGIVVNREQPSPQQPPSTPIDGGIIVNRDRPGQPPSPKVEAPAPGPVVNNPPSPKVEAPAPAPSAAPGPGIIVNKENTPSQSPSGPIVAQEPASPAPAPNLGKKEQEQCDNNYDNLPSNQKQVCDMNVLQHLGAAAKKSGRGIGKGAKWLVRKIGDGLYVATHPQLRISLRFKHRKTGQTSPSPTNENEPGTAPTNENSAKALAPATLTGQQPGNATVTPDAKVVSQPDLKALPPAAQPEKTWEQMTPEEQRQMSEAILTGMSTMIR